MKHVVKDKKEKVEKKGPGRPRNEVPAVPMNLGMPLTMWNRMNAYADSEDKSRSQVVREALDAYLTEKEKKQAKKGEKQQFSPSHKVTTIREDWKKKMEGQEKK